MGKGQHDAGSRYVRMLFNAGTVGGLTDRQLVERFTAQGGETAELAFATLVERHGPMVFGVCRSVLRDTHEAHDAFQATFLVLVRRAGSLWVRDSLGPWLHQVAYRVASSARSARPVGAGTNVGRPSCPARVCARRVAMTWGTYSTTR